MAVLALAASLDTAELAPAAIPAQPWRDERRARARRPGSAGARAQPACGIPPPRRSRARGARRQDQSLFQRHGRAQARRPAAAAGPAPAALPALRLPALLRVAALFPQRLGRLPGRALDGLLRLPQVRQ